MLPRRIGNMVLPADSANARRHGRLCCSGIKSSLGTVLDISASGLRIRCGRRGPSPGDTIEIFLVGSERCIKFAAKVVWARRTSFLKRELGLEYAEMIDDMRRSLTIIVRDASSTDMIRPLWEGSFKNAG